jgi:hypothetical protein
MTAMRWPELRLACAELAATQAMRLEVAQAAVDAERLRDLLRMRVTVRLSRWGAADRALLHRHRELQASLRALRRESTVRHAPVRIVSASAVADTCPACHDQRM